MSKLNLDVVLHVCENYKMPNGMITCASLGTEALHAAFRIYREAQPNEFKQFWHEQGEELKTVAQRVDKEGMKA